MKKEVEQILKDFIYDYNTAAQEAAAMDEYKRSGKKNLANMEDVSRYRKLALKTAVSRIVELTPPSPDVPKKGD